MKPWESGLRHAVQSPTSDRLARAVHAACPVENGHGPAFFATCGQSGVGLAAKASVRFAYPFPWGGNDAPVAAAAGALFVRKRRFHGRDTTTPKGTRTTPGGARPTPGALEARLTPSCVAVTLNLVESPPTAMPSPNPDSHPTDGLSGPGSAWPFPARALSAIRRLDAVSPPSPVRPSTPTPAAPGLRPCAGGVHDGGLRAAGQRARQPGHL